MTTINPRIIVAALTLSAAGFVGILSREGYTDTAVIPIPGDVATVGFGSTQGVKLGDRTTPVKAAQRALSDVGKYEGAIKQCVTAPLNQREYDSYTSLAYNIGSGAFCGSTLVRKLNAGDYAGACREILRWNRSGGRVVNGLTVRRQAEYQQCMDAQ